MMMMMMMMMSCYIAVATLGPLTPPTPGSGQWHVHNVVTVFRMRRTRCDDGKAECEHARAAFRAQRCLLTCRFKMVHVCKKCCAASVLCGRWRWVLSGSKAFCRASHVCVDAAATTTARRRVAPGALRWPVPVSHPAQLQDQRLMERPALLWPPESCRRPPRRPRVNETTVVSLSEAVT